MMGRLILRRDPASVNERLVAKHEADTIWKPTHTGDMLVSVLDLYGGFLDS